MRDFASISVLFSTMEASCAVGWIPCNKLVLMGFTSG